MTTIKQFLDEHNQNSTSESEPKTEKQNQKEPEQKLTRQEKQEQKKFVDTMMYGLTAPIVFGSSQWADTFPKDMHERARMMRLAKAIDCVKDEMCTLIDTVAYFYPLTMDAPLRQEYVKMYMYCYKHGLPDKWKILIKDDPDFERYTKLYSNEEEELRIIRRKIFRRQMDHVKKK